ncbi:MAG: efflux RND transporter periplasmic adaptor subunit [Planctomycetia bacterium]|nr:efflux RND transporter periplasmic adaptor subunit [Planctomycetia bacterium]
MEKKSKKHLSVLATFFVTALLLGLLWRFGGRSVVIPEDTSESIQLRVPLVELVEVGTESPLEECVYTGFAKEGKTVKQSFRVPGHLVDFDVEIGKHVSKGEVLAKLDPRDYALVVRRVEAGLVEANAALSMMKTGARQEDIAALEAALAAATSQFETADKNEKRFSELLKSGSASQAQYDQAKMARDSAQASRDAAEKQLEKGRAGARSEEIKAMEAKIAGLNIQLQEAKNALSDTVLLAPSDGYVSQKYVEAGENVAMAIPVLAFTDVSRIQVEVTIPEQLLVRQRDFVRYTCEFETYPGRPFPAELKEIGQAQQAGRQGYPLEVWVDAPADVVIHPGMAASLVIGVTRRDKPCVVPLAAVLADGDAVRADDEKDKFSGTRETIVWKLDSATHTVVKQPVTVVRVRNDGVEITGLSPGDRIVGAGARFLKEGQKVRLK